MEKLKNITFLAVLLCLDVTWGKVPKWSVNQKKLYAERRFIELEQSLILQKKNSLAKLVSRQSQDLHGCKYIHEGRGQGNSFKKCIDFMERERKLGLFSPGRTTAITDLNIICQRFAEVRNFLEVFLGEKGTVIKSKEWSLCSDALWRQVFLTTKAKFQGNPVATLSLVRMAKARLLPSIEWQNKTNEILGATL